MYQTYLWATSSQLCCHILRLDEFFRQLTLCKCWAMVLEHEYSHRPAQFSCGPRCTACQRCSQMEYVQVEERVLLAPLSSSAYAGFRAWSRKAPIWLLLSRFEVKFCWVKDTVCLSSWFIMKSSCSSSCPTGTDAGGQYYTPPGLRAPSVAGPKPEASNEDRYGRPTFPFSVPLPSFPFPIFSYFSFYPLISLLRVMVLFFLPCFSFQFASSCYNLYVHNFSPHVPHSRTSLFSPCVNGQVQFIPPWSLCSFFSLSPTSASSPNQDKQSQHRNIRCRVTEIKTQK